MNDYRLSAALHQQYILGNAPPTGILAFDASVFTEQTLPFLQVLSAIWPATILVVCEGDRAETEAELNRMEVRFDEILVVGDGESLDVKLAEHQVAYHFGKQAFAENAIRSLVSVDSEPEKRANST